MANETINFLIDDDQEIVSFNTGEGTTTDLLSGVGTPTYLPKYESGQILGDSIMYEDTGVSINVEGRFNVDTTSTSTLLSEDTTSLVTIDRAHTAAASGSVYGSKTTLNGNSSFLDGGVVASVSENFQNGSGGAFYSYGSMVKSNQYGSGDISFLSGQVIKVDAKADATSEIDYIRGLGLNCMVDSAFTTVNNIHCTRQKINLYEGTVGDVTVCLLDIDRTNATITGDIAYLHMQADAGSHTTTGGTARSIYSQNTLPSEFNGSISTPLLLVGEVKATDSIDTEFTNTDAETTRGFRSVVTKDATADGGDCFGGSFKTINTSTGNIINLQGVSAVAEHTGSGDVSFIVGTRGVASHNGTGDMNGGVYGSFNDARSRGTGVCALNYILGGNNTAELDNPNATINNLVGSISEVSLKKGTVGELVACYVDFDYNEQGLATVTRDFSMIKIESHSTPPVAGTARAIWSESTLPSELAGDLKVSGALNVGTTGDHADNAAAIIAGLAVGDVYRTGDLLKVVH